MITAAFCEAEPAYTSTDSSVGVKRVGVFVYHDGASPLVYGGSNPGFRLRMGDGEVSVMYDASCAEPYAAMVAAVMVGASGCASGGGSVGRVSLTVACRA